jgi:hypothetical protein
LPHGLTRCLLLAQARYPGRLAALDAPNIDAFGLVTNLKTFTPSRAADRLIERTALAGLRKRGAAGRTLLHDIDVYLQDLRTLTGTRFAQPLMRRYCGAGDPAACARALWGAFEAAGAALEAAESTANPDAWTDDANKERITFRPGLLKTTIRYTNRPSGIQQVLSFSGHRPR